MLRITEVERRPGHVSLTPHSALLLRLWFRRRTADQHDACRLFPLALELAVEHRLPAHPTRVRFPVDQRERIAPDDLLFKIGHDVFMGELEYQIDGIPFHLTTTFQEPGIEKP